jgi:hypothetical protein
VHVTLDGKNGEPHGKGIDQDEAQPEDRQRESEHRKDHHPTIDPRADVTGRERSQWNRQADGNDQREHGERQCGLQPLGDELRHRQPREDGSPQVTSQQLAHPYPELRVKRFVQPGLLADLHDVFGIGIVPRNDGGGVARRQPQQTEHEDGHNHHHWDRGQNPFDKIAPQFLLSPGKMGSVAS